MAQTPLQAYGNRGQCTGCNVRLCIFCGCTDDHGCIHPNFPGGELNCEWVATGTCSSCNFRMIEEEYYVASGQPEKIVPPSMSERPRIVLAHNIPQEAAL